MCGREPERRGYRCRAGPDVGGGCPGPPRPTGNTAGRNWPAPVRYQSKWRRHIKKATDSENDSSVQDLPFQPVSRGKRQKSCKGNRKLPLHDNIAHCFDFEKRVCEISGDCQRTSAKMLQKQTTGMKHRTNAMVFKGWYPAAVVEVAGNYPGRLARAIRERPKGYVLP